MDAYLNIAKEVGNYIDHHRKLEEDMNELKSEYQVLKRRKIDINSRIQVQVRSGQLVKKEVKGWLKDVQKTKKDIQHVEERVRRVPFYQRASLDKLVREKIEVVRRIQERGNFNEDLVVESAPAGITIPTDNLVGEIPTKDEIWKYLMGDDVGMIGVCGTGGVGKTTIMKNVHNDLQRETRFKKVIWVTVSYPLNVLELQKKIAGAMGERLPEDEEVMMRAAALMEILTRVRYVVILDDVWEKFSLKDVGIPGPTEQNGCKVVITSRSIEVCSYWHCKIVQVQPLSQEDSRKLFLDTVGDGVLQVAGLEDTLKLIVKECAGLPLAIVVIAASMRGVDDVDVWRNALTELQDRVQTVSGWDDQIFRRLRFSYDRLGRLDIQKCFLYCSLFREDYEFSRMELIEGWIDDGLIDIDDFVSRQKAYDRGGAFLDKLVKNCLIEKTAGEFESWDVFKMHDVVRDMAIKSIGPEFGYMVKEWRKVPKEHGWATDFKKLSLMAFHISKLPVGWSLKCPSLSTLILSDNHLSEIPNSIFEDMGALMVLDLSRTDIEALPDSISNLVNLSTLRLRRCKRLKCLPSLGKLGALKKLGLRESGIEEVPQGMEMLESLEYLDLLFCRRLKEIPTGTLPKLSSLQYLALCDLEGTSRKIELEEVSKLRKLEIFECRLDDIHELNSFVSESKNFQRLTAYSLAVTTNKDALHLLSAVYYKCYLMMSELEIGGECMVLPDKLEYLYIHNCKNMRSSFNKTVLLENATELRKCAIVSCKEIECVVDLDSLCCPVLDRLEHLRLWNLPRLCVLVRVQGAATPPRVFSNLKTLKIRYCSEMKKLLPLELLQALQNLEKIEVSDCQQMEEIIASSESDSDASPDKFTFTFPKLKKFSLRNLPQLKSICSTKRVMVCDSIEEISIWECPELKRMPFQLPLLDNGQPSPPPCLRQIGTSGERWESMEWDHPNAKNLLQPFLNYSDFWWD